MAFLCTLEMVSGYLEQAEHHTLLRDRIASSPVTPLFCFPVITYKSLVCLVSLIVHSGWEH